ncbi:hypothetical protein ACTA71_001239 [Dictyostelium dimigraforme]
MEDNTKYRFKEPDFSFPDYYKVFINAYPEQFNQISEDIKNDKIEEKKYHVEVSCFDQKMEYEACKEKLSILESFFCYEEAHKYHQCVKVNSSKFDRYLKYYINRNKLSYMKYWENQEKEYLEKLQQTKK